MSTSTSYASDLVAHQATAFHTSNLGGEARSAEGAQPLLGNIAESFGNPLLDRGASARRAERYRVRDQLRRITRDDRLKWCGAHSIRALGSVDVRRSAGPDGPVVGVSGLASCGRWYSCPFCAARIAARRREEIAQGVAAAVADGLVVAMLTLTVRHKASDALHTLLEALSAGWTAVGQDKAVRRLRKALGWVGYVRVLEMTFGLHGWHPHLHFLVFLDASVAEGGWGEDAETGAWRIDLFQLEALGQATLRSWKAGVTRLGLRSPNRHGMDLRVLAAPTEEVADYLTKMGAVEMSADTAERVRSASFEMTGSMHKQGKALPSGRVLSRTSWDVVRSAAEGAAAFVAGGELVSAIERFWELEEALKGRAMTVWSKGLKQRFCIGEQTDDAIVQEELSGPEATVIGLPLEGVRRTQAKGWWHGLTSSVLRQGRAGGAAFCDRHGIEWLEPDDPTLIADRVYRQWHGESGWWAAQDMARAIHEQRAVAAACGDRAP